MTKNFSLSFCSVAAYLLFVFNAVGWLFLVRDASLLTGLRIALSVNMACQMMYFAHVLGWGNALSHTSVDATQLAHL